MRRPIDSEEGFQQKRDLNSINRMLKNSFRAIKVDMIHLKDVQEEQLKEMGALKKDIKENRHGQASKDDLAKLKDHVAGMEAKQKVLLGKLEDVQKHSDEVIQAVNDRIRDINKEFEKILKLKEELKEKVQRIDQFDDDVRSLRKHMVTRTYLQTVVNDINSEFDRIDDRNARKTDMLKLAKKVESLQKKVRK
ncbi:MAG: hypothetical protein ACE5DM_01115 [Candidatus Nanoarchaeia archaeon]